MARQWRSASASKFGGLGTMTPMIDVVFLLLIFFVVASVGQTREQSLRVRLGAGSTAPADLPREFTTSTQVWIHVSYDQASSRTSLRLGERPVATLAELIALLQSLAELAPENPVILDIDDDVPAREFIAVYDACRQLPLESISFGI